MSKIKTRIDVFNVFRLLVICLVVSLVVGGCLISHPIDDTEDPEPEKQSVTEEFNDDLSDWELSAHSAAIGSFALKSGVLSYTAEKSSFLKWTVLDKSVTDYAIEASVRFLTKPQYSGFGVVLRQTGGWQWLTSYRDSNGYWVQFLPWNGKVTLEKRTKWNIVDSTYSQQTLDFALGEWYTFRVEIQGDLIKAFVNDQEVLAWTDEKEPLQQGSVWISLGVGQYEIDRVVWREL